MSKAQSSTIDQTLSEEYFIAPNPARYDAAGGALGRIPSQIPA